MFKRLLLVALAASTVASVTGCGRAATPLAPMAGMSRQASAQPTVFVAGKKRQLGYDVDRYLGQQARRAKLRQLPPTQGLLPARVDLRNMASPVADQYDLGACTAFAVGKGLREFLQARRGEQARPLSALFLYYETRKLRGTTHLDSGATITDAMQAIAKAGISSEKAWPYEPLVFDTKPPAAAYGEAKANRLTGGIQLSGLEDMRKTLAKGTPVVFGMRVFNTFRNVGADGKLEVPQNGDIFVGGHAVCAVGYDNKKKALIVKNSWGTEWGQKGYFYMPYAYVTPENVMDIWTVQ